MHRSRETTAPTICWSPTSSAPTSCRSGLSQSMWWMRPSRLPRTGMASALEPAIASWWHVTALDHRALCSGFLAKLGRDLFVPGRCLDVAGALPVLGQVGIAEDGAERATIDDHRQVLASVHV